MATNAKAKTDEFIDASAETAEKGGAQIREIAEKSVQQAKDGYAKLKVVAEEASDTLEAAYATATKGYKELTLKSVDAARSNVNAHFDFLHALIGAKSVSQAVELQSSYARQQFEVVSGQLKELSALAQKAAQDGAKPLKDLAANGLRYAPR